MKKILLFLLSGSIIAGINAQEQLPDFSVYKVGNNRVVVAWTHNYQGVKQISIQRSTDSLNYFKTVGTMPDPSLQQNGFPDATAPSDNMFYRIFVMFEGGKYISTKSKRPVVDSSGLADAYNSGNKSNTEVNLNPNFIPSGFVQSAYIFASTDRYVRVELPLDKRKYDIKFYAENGQPLFELNDIKEKRFKLDRSYFSTAGYINFELYADGRLLEKHKVFLPKDF
ncbi:hypothetical protein U0035_20935 [Niabella yanshanensis]|uniref:Rhamnogalacturonan lyase domain-containing protein n=1 Tax=Niabella yanshanensis TaxID=577386 RepID=A0ABZ0W4H0_9BACT|nr:hypothetical protein [Niabella yanshanensis]WQD38137.1 hypothetical protein U0035_20935 [Niabella yanshanensis]